MGVGFLLVGILWVGKGRTCGTMVQIWTKHTYLYVKYTALSDLPCTQNLRAKQLGPVTLIPIYNYLKVANLLTHYKSRESKDGCALNFNLPCI